MTAANKWYIPNLQMILIFYALRRELSGLRKRIHERGPLGDGLRGFKGRIGKQEVVLVATGIGPAQGREAARRAVRTLPRPRLVISTGVAGGLAPHLRAGDLVVADRLLMERPQDSSLEEVVRVSPEIVRYVQDALGGAGLPFATGPLLTLDRVLASASAKHAASRRSGAIAVDMESAAIAVEVAVAGLPLVCVRAVIDGIDDEIPGAELPDATGHVAPLRAAAYFLSRPAALMQVPALLRNLARATASIADALEALCVEPSI
ncbi:MAG: hypothetical protein ACLQU2_05135 [Candidatus Binataceae bacterium]